MALVLTLDEQLQIIAEPGYFQAFSTRDLTERADPTDASRRAFFFEHQTGTMMLQPLQLQPGWLNSSSQLDSIIGLTDRGSGKLVTNPTNISNKTLFEANKKQNENNPWLFFSPIPGTVTTFVELLAQLGLIALDALSGWPTRPSDARVIAYTEETLVGNQPLYLRWAQPDSQAADLNAVMGFTIGQFALIFSGDQLEIMEDISPGMDRTEWRHMMYAPLFSPGVNAALKNNGRPSLLSVSETPWQERAILWIPYARNRVYIEASSGQSAILVTRPTPELYGAGASQDWHIVADRPLLIWAVTQSVGCFQVQKVKFFGGGAAQELRLPHFVIDYSPVDALAAANIRIAGDAFRGTALTAGDPTTPPGYDDFVNRLNECAPPVSDGTDLSRTYGTTINFQSDAGQRFTPFLYGIGVVVERVADTWPVAATLVTDTGLEPARITSASLTTSLEPGDSQLDCNLFDFTPYPLAEFYFRANAPLRLTDTGPDPDQTLWIGYTEPNILEPLHAVALRPKGLRIEAGSLWKRLAESYLRDQRDWTGEGHIDVVDFIVRQAGIDTTGADYPTPLAAWNTKLGGLTNIVPIEGLDPAWKPGKEESAADFILRIARNFAGFIVGFYPTGQFYYLPANPFFYNTSELTFYPAGSVNPAGPFYRSPVSFEPVEPEANVVQVFGTDARTGGGLRSSRFVDWASILNPAVVNFIGHWKFKAYPWPGVVTCEEINRIAYTIFKQARRRRLLAKFEGDYVPGLRVGRLFTLNGYAGLWRLLSCRADYVKTGWKPARYEAQLHEDGWGLP